MPADNFAGCAKIRQITNKGGVLVPLSEQQARGNIDVLLEAAGWYVCDAAAVNIHAARGVAIREFPLPGYLLRGVIHALEQKGFIPPLVKAGG
jgi:hypothetical protein